MAKKKAKSPTAATSGACISNCCFTAEAGTVSVETARAVAILAEACSAHARAIEKLAEALKGTQSGRMENAISIDGGRE